MLKTRLIGVLIVKGGIVVQSINFRRYLPVGSPAVAVDYLNRWGIDEIVLLDIDASPESRSPELSKIAEFSKCCQVPLTVGGGIRTVEDIEKTIHAGADKIVINSAAVDTPDLISEGAELFGAQCIMVSIDAGLTGNGEYRAFTDSGRCDTGRSPVDLAEEAEKRGAGEILINSIDRDGSKTGYDLELLGQVCNAVDIPVIACGGVGHPEHFREAAGLNLSGLAAANFFHFTEHSAVVAKSFLKSAREQVRLDTYAKYENCTFDMNGRADKRSDEYLDKLRFEYIPEEII